MKLYQGMFAVAVVMAGLSRSEDAEAMQCGNRLASPGDSLYRVRSVCGEPDDAQRRVELRSVSRRVLRPCVVDNKKSLCEEVVEETFQVVIDEWTYDFGKNRFIRYLTFEQGKLIRIDSGSYGSKAPK
jgi:hypothetical protein